jgi:hypothetical protein
MDEYLYKLEKLSIERLEMLVKLYTKTIQQLQLRIRDATVVALNSVIEYSQQEVARKQAELLEIEKILEAKRLEIKKEQV